MAPSIKHTPRGDVVEIPSDEFEQLQETLDFLEHEELKHGVLAGLREHREGRSRPWSDVRDELN